MSEGILTKKQVFLCRLCLGAGLGVLGLFLLLCGTNVLPIALAKIAAPAALIAAALVAFCWGFIQENTLLLWLAPFLLTAAVATSWVIYHSFSGFYPLYFFCPAVASLFTALLKGKWHYHLEIIIPASITGSLLLVASQGAASYKIILPILVLLVGAAITAYAFKTKKSKEDEK